MGLDTVQLEIKTLLKRHRFSLVSQNHHYKFQNPEGRIFVCSKTPSDIRAARNMLATLKQVIRDPVPSSLCLEEERQRRELEKSIQLSARERRGHGVAGPARTNGTGIHYYDKEVSEETAAFVPDEVKAAEIARHIEMKWDGLKRHLAQQVKRAERDLAKCYAINYEMTKNAAIREQFAENLKDLRRYPETRLGLRQRLHMGEYEKWRAEVWDLLAAEYEENRKENVLELAEPGKQLYELALFVATGSHEHFNFRFADKPPSAEETDHILPWLFGIIYTSVRAGKVPKWLQIHFPQDKYSFIDGKQFQKNLRQVIKKPRFATLRVLLSPASSGPDTVHLAPRLTQKVLNEKLEATK